jgi:hypothetical protein
MRFADKDEQFPQSDGGGFFITEDVRPGNLKPETNPEAIEEEKSYATEAEESNLNGN